MSRLSDSLIAQLASQESPRAYSFEVRDMAMEILEWRTKAADAAKAAQPAPQGQLSLGGGWSPYVGGIP